MNFIIHVPIFFIFLPYLGVSIFPSDIQPFAVIFSFISVLYLLAKRNGQTKIHIIVLPTIVMLLIAIISFIIQIIFGSENEMIILLRVLYGYITAPIIIVYMWLLLKNYSYKKTISILDFVLFVTFLGFILNLLQYNFITNFFVNRNIQNYVIGGSRGFVSFYPEQSRISEQMGVLFFMYLMTKSMNLIRLFFILVAIVLSFAGQSYVVLLQIGISFSLAYLIKIYINKRLNFKLISYGIVIIAIIYFSPILIDVLYDVFLGFNLPLRGIGVIRNILNNGLHSISNDNGVIIKSSGAILALSSIIRNPFSFNLATIPNQIDEFNADLFFSIQNFVHGNNVIILPSRIYSSVGTWIVEFGLIGMIMTIFLFGIFFINIRKNLKDDLILVAAGIFLVIILFIKIPPANPSTWSFMTYIIFLSRIKNDLIFEKKYSKKSRIIYTNKVNVTDFIIKENQSIGI